MAAERLTFSRAFEPIIRVLLSWFDERQSYITKWDSVVYVLGMAVGFIVLESGIEGAFDEVSMATGTANSLEVVDWCLYVVYEYMVHKVSVMINIMCLIVHVYNFMVCKFMFMVDFHVYMSRVLVVMSSFMGDM